MNRKKHLPLFGVGIIYVFVISLLNFIFINLSINRYIPVLFSSFNIINVLFLILGLLLILGGIYLWIHGAIFSKLGKKITKNVLVTSGVFSYTRNPIYVAFLFICTGTLLLFGNIYLLVLPFIYYIFLSVLLFYTEEKWLYKLYRDKYLLYCARVNRCFPWKGDRLDWKKMNI